MHKVQSGNYAFLYAAVMGVDWRDSYLRTGKLHTLGTAEVTSIAGLQDTERKKKGKEKKKIKEKKQGGGGENQHKAWPVSLKCDYT